MLEMLDASDWRIENGVILKGVFILQFESSVIPEYTFWGKKKKTLKTQQFKNPVIK